MKKSIFIGCILCFTLVNSSCNDDGKISSSEVPQHVVAAFNAKYPDAAGTEWKTEKSEGKLIYEAKFQSGEKKIEAEFFENGAFKQEE